MAFMKLLLSVFFLQSLFANSLMAEMTPKSIAVFYKNQNWQKFFAQSFLYRGTLKNRIEKDEVITEEDLSLLVLESLGYMRHCQFEKSKKILQATDIIYHYLKTKNQSIDPEKIIENDLSFLKSLFQNEKNPSLRKQKIASKNDTYFKDLDIAKEKTLWPIPANQKSNKSIQKSLFQNLETKVKNLCKGAA